MLDEPCWLEVDGIVYLNARIVEASGEPHQLVSPELLESGCARARNLWAYEGETDVATLAASVLFGIARNHPFLQGNKRTAYMAMIGFLGANSFRFQVEDDEAIGDDIVAVLEGAMSEEHFADMVRAVIEFVAMQSWRGVA